MAWNAMRIACSDDEQYRFTVVPGTDSGNPASSPAARATLSRDWPTAPHTTSSMLAGSMPLLSTTCLMAAASMSSGRTSTKDPLPARPIGVRPVATMTASGTGLPLLCRLRGSIGRPDNLGDMQQLRDATDLLGDGDGLRARLSENGYLF